MAYIVKALYSYGVCRYCPISLWPYTVMVYIVMASYSYIVMAYIVMVGKATGVYIVTARILMAYIDMAV